MDHQDKGGGLDNKDLGKGTMTLLGMVGEKLNEKENFFKSKDQETVTYICSGCRGGGSL